MAVRHSFPSCSIARLAFLWLSFVCTGGAAAQELVPRAYFPAPAGTDILVLGYQYSTGDLAFEPALPVSGVESDAHFGMVAYQRFLDGFGRTSTVQVSLPYSTSRTDGFVSGVYRRRDMSGFGDLKIRVAINLAGAPTLTPESFRELLRNPVPIVGASLLVSVPTGDYDAERLLNIGANRWAVKPALGMILPTGLGWYVEAELGVWIFGDNEDFVGTTKEQNPLLSTEMHLVRTRRPDFWYSLDANFYTGGRTTVNGDVNQDLQRNSRLGVTVYKAFGRGHGLKVSLSTGLSTEIGGDFDMLALNYVYAW